MTVPCDSKSDIQEIQKEQRQQGKDIAVVKESADRLRMEQAAFISESREVISLLKEMAIEGKSTARQAKEAQDILFQKTRENAIKIRENEEKIRDSVEKTSEIIDKALAPLRTDITTLMSFKIISESKTLLFKDMRVTIPVICTLLVTFLMLWDRFKLTF
jgi:hypothetical protein